MQIKRGDLAPDLVLTVEDLAGVADLHQVTGWRIICTQRGIVVVDDAPDSVVVDPTNKSKATLTRSWLAGETAQIGDMRVEAEAMWPGNRPQTFPPGGYEMVRINPDLG